MSDCRIFLGNVSSRTDEDDIHKFFKGFGRIREISLKNGFGFVEFERPEDANDAIYDLNGKELRGNNVTIEPARMRGSGSFRRGSSRGDYRGGDRYGGDRGDRYGGDRFGGGRFDDRYGYRGGGDRFGGGDRYGAPPRRYAPPNNTDYRVIVENLSSRVSWQDLKDFMRQAGEATFADANRNREGEGLVCFASYSDMKKAIEKLDGKELLGRPVKLIADYRGGSRSRSRSPRSRSPASRSRSRSGSKSRDRNRDRASKSKSRRSRSRTASRSPRPAARSASRSRSPSHDD